MNSLFSRILGFIVLVLLQVFLLNRIHLFGYVTPMLYVYFILTLSQSVPQNRLMLWSFALGLVIDAFSNTLGIHAAASTLIAFLRPVLIRLFYIRDEGEFFVPSLRTMGGAFRRYALLAIFIHHTAVILLQYFSLAYPLQMGIAIAGSTLLTMLMVMAIERIIGQQP